MAWIYLAESEGFNSAFLHGYPQPLIVKQTDTAKEFFCREWTLENSGKPQYGTMLEPSQGLISRTAPFHRSLERSILFPEDSPARILALRELEQGWLESEADYSSRSLGLWASYNHDSSSWKMSQLSLLEEDEKSQEPLPRFGMIVDGECYQLSTWERRTNENGGSSLPTPVTVDGGSYFNKSKSEGAANRPTLGAMAKHDLWPTPTVYGNHQTPKAGTNRGTGLSTAVKTWPTPRVQSASGSGPSRIGNKADLQTQAGGLLNPMWVEWLMGYPSEWTELKDWAMLWFRPKRVRHFHG